MVGVLAINEKHLTSSSRSENISLKKGYLKWDLKAMWELAGWICGMFKEIKLKKEKANEPGKL